MEAAGLSFAVVTEVRGIVTSIKTRIANYRQGPDIIRTLSDTLDLLMGHMESIETLRDDTCLISADISSVFDAKLRDVRKTLLHSNVVVEKACLKTFGRSDSRLSKLISRICRVALASEFHDTMSGVQKRLEVVSNELLHLTTILGTELTRQQLHDTLVPKLDMLQITGAVAEVYHPALTTPGLSHTVTLNFDAMDEEGKCMTPEGMLKRSILSTKSLSSVTVAPGVLQPAYGVVGMAGVGKTIALRGLAFDDDIRIRFPGGIQYIALGQSATTKTVIQEIAKIMTLTGASTSVCTLERSESLSKAVDYAVAWFRGKICLFLVDDLWPTKGCQTGFLNDLQQLLRGCPHSRMAITTRSIAIAQSSGHRVDFEPRDRFGSISFLIFMMHATDSASSEELLERNREQSNSITKILAVCNGLPIALAVAGRAVARTRGNRDFESTCDNYATRLDEQRFQVGTQEGPEGPSLNLAILASLECLEDEFLKMKKENSLNSDHALIDLYTSLCVLNYQAWIPVSVLSRLWKIDIGSAFEVASLFYGLSLCTLEYRSLKSKSASEAGLILHDLHLEFCKRQAAKTNTSSLWHVRLLNGYRGDVLDSPVLSFANKSSELFERRLLEYTPKQWWSFADDGYIHASLTRHLSFAKFGLELASLVMDARWTFMRMKVGGILSLREDFEFLKGPRAIHENSGRGIGIPSDIILSLELIFEAIHRSWGRISEGRRAFLFQLRSRLLNLSEGDAIVKAFLKSAELYTPLPHLIPLTPFFPDDQLMDIPVGSKCSAVTYSPCGRYIVAGGDNDVFVIDAATGAILKRLRRHTMNVLSVSFAAGSKIIVSGSEDTTACVWEWETSLLPIRILEGHDGAIGKVTCSSDSKNLFSCSYDGSLKIWDVSTGKQKAEVMQGKGIWCLALHCNDRTVAIGLEDGSLKVLDCSSGEVVFECGKAHKSALCSVAFSTDGRWLITGSYDETILMWDTETWSAIGDPIQGHNGYVYGVAFIPHGQYFASASGDGRVRLWNTRNGKNLWTSSSVHCWVKSVAFSPDGEKIVSTSRDGSVRIWDPWIKENSKGRKQGRDARVTAVAISHDGLRVASGSNDGKICLWDSCTGMQIGSAFKGHTSCVFCVSFSPDGGHVVSGSRDNTLRLWDTEKHRQIGDPLKGHTNALSCVSFSSNGIRVVSGSWDHSVRIWNVQSGEQMGDALEDHTRISCAVSETCDGYHVVSRYRDGVVLIWNVVGRAIVWKYVEGLLNPAIQNPDQILIPGPSHMTDEEAKKIIRLCGEEASHLWPQCFPVELHSCKRSVYWCTHSENVLIGTLPFYAQGWRYNDRRKVFVAHLQSGVLALCSFQF